VYAPASHTEVYRARRGESLVTIADRFGVSLEDLHRWNHSTGTAIVAGQRIRVAEPAHVASHSLEPNHVKGQQDNTKAKPQSKGAATAKPTGKSRTGSSSSSSTKPTAKPASKQQSAAPAAKTTDAKKKKAPSQQEPHKKLQK